MKLNYKAGEFLDAPIYINISVSIWFVYFILKHGFFTGVVSGFCLIVLMLIHEMGHAWYVKKYQHDLIKIRLNLFHGCCEYDIDGRYAPETMIYAGGLFFQLLLLIVFLALLGLVTILGLQHFEFIYKPFILVFVYINAAIFVINALPIPGFDGFDLWFRFRGIYRDKVSSLKKKTKTKKKLASRPSPEKVVDIEIKRAQKKRK